MIVVDDKKRIDCCILVADVKAPEINYSSSERFVVAIPDIAEITNFIEKTFIDFGRPCERVYFSGCRILTEDDITRKKAIVEKIGAEVAKIQAGIKAAAIESIQEGMQR